MSPEIEQALVDWWLAAGQLYRATWTNYSGEYAKTRFSEIAVAETDMKRRLFDVIDAEHGGASLRRRATKEPVA